MSLQKGKGIDDFMRNKFIISFLFTWIFLTGDALYFNAYLSSDFILLNVADAQNDDDEVKKDRKYINLVVGLDENIKVPHMPKKHQFKGDFKRLTSVTYLKNLRTLRFSPKKVGSATLTIQDARGRIISEFFLTIRRSDLNKVAKEIQLLLSEVDGITVRIINNKVIVDGQVLLPKELSRIYSVVEQYGDKASNLVTLSPIAQRKIAEYIERDINNPQIHVRNVNGKFLLEGVADVGSTPENRRERDRAEAIAKVYFPDIEVVRGEGKVIRRVSSSHVINLIRIPSEQKPPPREKPPDKLIQIIVHFVELQKDYTKFFRFDWTPQLGDQTKYEFRTQSSSGLGGIVGAISGTISNLLPKLNWAKEHGHARVLHSASVIVKDKSPGVINSTTKIPYIGVQAVGGAGIATGTQFTEPVGIQSRIVPSVVGSNDNIQLDVSFQVSTPGSGSPPRISKNEIRTLIIVRSRESAAIGGLVTQNSGTNYNKQPDSGGNPLISLYASKDFRKDQTQFVVFVTPIIKASASSGADRIKRKFRLYNN